MTNITPRNHLFRPSWIIKQNPKPTTLFFKFQIYFAAVMKNIEENSVISKMGPQNKIGFRKKVALLSKKWIFARKRALTPRFKFYESNHIWKHKKSRFWSRGNLTFQNSNICDLQELPYNFTLGNVQKKSEVFMISNK